MKTALDVVSILVGCGAVLALLSHLALFAADQDRDDRNRSYAGQTLLIAVLSAMYACCAIVRRFFP